MVAGELVTWNLIDRWTLFAFATLAVALLMAWIIWRARGRIK